MQQRPLQSKNFSSEDHVSDLRLTPQRREVLEVLMEKKDHPTATEVFIRAKNRMPSISLATVYNCLEALSHAGLVKQVNLDRSPSRYCPNLKEHAHFHCENCGAVTDLELQADTDARSVVRLPRGSAVHKFEVALRGFCPKCAKNS